MNQETEDLKAVVRQLNERVERMDKTIYYGLRGLVMLIDHLETAVNPMSEPEQKAESLVKVREIIDQMRTIIK